MKDRDNDKRPNYRQLIHSGDTVPGHRTAITQVETREGVKVPVRSVAFVQVPSSNGGWKTESTILKPKRGRS